MLSVYMYCVNRLQADDCCGSLVLTPSCLNELAVVSMMTNPFPHLGLIVIVQIL
jgi:hypothetical protein